MTDQQHVQRLTDLNGDTMKDSRDLSVAQSVNYAEDWKNKEVSKTDLVVALLTLMESEDSLDRFRLMTYPIKTRTTHFNKLSCPELITLIETYQWLVLKNEWLQKMMKEKGISDNE